MKKFSLTLLALFTALVIVSGSFADGITIQARGAKKGVNNDITSMTGLDNDGIPLAKVANAASDGANGDITSLTALDGSDLDINSGYLIKAQNLSDMKNANFWFDLANDSLTAEDNINLDVRADDFSLGIKIKPDSITTANQFIINKEAGGIGYGLEQRLNDLWIRFDDGTTDVSAIIGTDIFLVGVSYDIVVTFDRDGNATAYIGGASVGTVDISSANLSLDNAGAFTIGTETGGTTKPFGGIISKARLDNICLLKSDPEQEAIINGAVTPYVYVGANQSNKIILQADGDFSGGNNWYDNGMATFDSTGDLTVTSNASGQTALIVSNKFTYFSPGQKYRIVVEASALSGDPFVLDFSTGGQTSPGLVDGYNVWEFTRGSLGNNFEVKSTGTGGITLDNFWMTKTGNIASYEQDGVIAGGWVDGSGNGNNLVLLGCRPTNLVRGIENLLSITNVAFNSDADTVLLTVPPWYSARLTKAIIVAGANANSTDITIGQNGAESDFLPTNQMDNLDTDGDVVIVKPIPNTTPLQLQTYAAGTVIEMNVANQAGGATNTVYLYGILN
ncbi:MAG: hypothetical protein HN597_03565 [Desulfobacula sp.]|jgi:hypothetical protein|uniref:LamG-like jellyroll fold domain-containing protein n=1 Tax=Desulfobacula sp. TaxID=2593537 RepID=UPI0039B9AFF4|nr:hypothetical protein [Desulfobacula sp.]